MLFALESITLLPTTCVPSTVNTPFVATLPVAEIVLLAVNEVNAPVEGVLLPTAVLFNPEEADNVVKAPVDRVSAPIDVLFIPDEALSVVKAPEDGVVLPIGVLLMLAVLNEVLAD